MKPKDVNILFLNKFPEIKEEFDKYIEWQDGYDTGSTLVAEDVLMHFVFDKFSKNDKEFISYFCQAIEDLYSLNDEYLTNVIDVAILENIKCSEFSEIVNEYLLPKTKASYLSIIF